VRERAPFAARRASEDFEGFIRELVREWGFTEEDARALSPDRRSWMAVPIVGRKGVVAVVYLDSSAPDFFEQPVRELVLKACAGFASYTLDAY
jgi:hypothetical protein